jgi:O-antigen/teichoic acid export membrane protein
MAVMSIATYGFTMIAARMLGPGAYGALVAMMNTLLVVSVLQLGLQATAARRISSTPDHVAQIEQNILRVTWRASLILGVVMLAISPLVNQVLRLDSMPTAILMALTAVPMTMMGGQAGILQGERRWYPLAALYLANGVPRLLIGWALIAWHPDEFTAMIGVALGQVVPVLVGWWTLRHTRQPGIDTTDHRLREVVRETLHNSQALLAFFALSVGGVVPAAAGADRDVERHGSCRRRAAHLSRTSASSASRSPGATSKHELVVHLQQHPRPQPRARRSPGRR